MKRSLRRALLTFVLIPAVLTSADRGFAFTIEKIADCSDVAGGETGCIFFSPTTHAGVVTFAAVGVYQCLAYNNPTQQILQHRDGDLEVVVNHDTPMPGVEGFTFGDGEMSPLEVSSSATGLAFAWSMQEPGNQSPFKGVYGTSAGTLYAIADPQTPVPGGPGTFFEAYETPALDDVGGVAFFALWYDADNKVHAGVWRSADGTTELVAEYGAQIPDRTESFSSWFSDLSLDEGRIAFTVRDTNTGTSGVYSDIGGSLHVIADIHTPIPGGTGNFAGASDVSISGQQVALTGYDKSFNVGIYISSGQLLELLADANTPLPGAAQDFSVGSPSLDKGSVAFFIVSPGDIDHRVHGIYTTYGGALTKVVDTTDEGFHGLNIVGLALGGNQIVFTTTARDCTISNNSAVYVATLTDFCRNRVIDAGEECDDGNNTAGDGCNATCRTEFCGDGIVNNAGTEQCDDGNLANGDGCSASCTVENTTTTSTTTLPTAVCGDVNGSDSVTVGDALLILKAAVGGDQCAEKPCACDVAGGGSIEASDALAALKIAVGQSIQVSCVC